MKRDQLEQAYVYRNGNALFFMGYRGGASLHKWNQEGSYSCLAGDPNGIHFPLDGYVQLMTKREAASILLGVSDEMDEFERFLAEKP